MSARGLGSWGNYPHYPQTPTACFWRNDLPDLLRHSAAQYGSTLPYGAGLSYGDSCLAASDQVLEMRRLDRFLAVDWQSGVLRAECGVTLGDILALVVPRGWFLTVTPGTRHVTLGGAIANDVHGKNHHRRGSFGCHVRCLGLVRSDMGRMTCSTIENREYFCATLGGLGLTGIIEWAEIQLMPIGSSRLSCLTQRFGHLDEFFALADELDAQHEFCVSWIDCLAQGKSSGRGVYRAADFCADGSLQVAHKRPLTVPFTPPFSLINRLTLRAFNALYWRRAPGERQRTDQGMDAFFYPLDAIRQWNRIYGARGFQQYQALIPAAVARDGIAALLAAIAASGEGSFLAVLKRCGEISSPGLISFPRPGVTLALDFPHSARLGAQLFPRLDAIVRESGGRLYPAKDAHLAAADFRQSYPAWAQLEALRDPALLSRFWQRVMQ